MKKVKKLLSLLFFSVCLSLSAGCVTNGAQNSESTPPPSVDDDIGGDYGDGGDFGEDDSDEEPDEEELQASEGLSYIFSEDATYYIVTGIGKCQDSNVVIPSEFNGLPVKAIAYGAFGSNLLHTNYIRGVVIPKSVQWIGESAFANAKYLTSVDIRGPVEEIDYTIFNNCERLSSIRLSDSVKVIRENAFSDTEYYNNSENWENNALYIGKHLIAVDNAVVYGEFTVKEGTRRIAGGAFRGSAYLKKVILPNSVEYIGDNAFTNCQMLTEVVMPAVKYIGQNAFSETGLTKAELPSVLQYVGAGAFADTSITEIEIPASVTEIGENVFVGCEQVTQIKVAEGNTAYSSVDGNLYDKSGTTFLQYAPGKTEEEFAFSDKVTVVGKNAFGDNRTIKKIVMPDSIIKVEESAFSGLALTEMVLSNNLREVGENAFNLNGLEKITMTASVIEYIPKSNLKEVTITGGEIIPESSFKNCGNLTRAEITGNVTAIGNYAFHSCGKLESVIITAVTETIGEGCFQGCGMLRSITLPNTLKEIGAYAFKKSGLTHFEMPHSVTQIGTEVFYECAQLQEISLSSALSEIPEVAFRYCEALTTVEFPASVKVIRENAFLWSGLNEIVIPETVEKIEYHAFMGCRSLEKLIYHHNAERECSTAAFDDCWGLADITVPAYLLPYLPCSNVQKVVITMGESIADEVFYDCEKLKSIQLPAELKIIGKQAFEYCDVLETIELPESLTYIGERAFGRTALKQIVIPDSVETIGVSAFTVCESLTSVKLPSGLVEIPESTFWNCKSLKTINFPQTLEKIGKDALEHCNITEAILPNGLKEIGHSAFTACDNLHTLVIPDSVYSIGNGAFGSCDNLSVVTMPAFAHEFIEKANLKTLTITSGEIEGWAFSNRRTLERLTIGSGVTAIGGYAFTGCENLKEVVFENPMNWHYKDNKAVLGWSPIMENIADKSVAADCLTNKYCKIAWNCIP